MDWRRFAPLDSREPALSLPNGRLSLREQWRIKHKAGPMAGPALVVDGPIRG